MLLHKWHFHPLCIAIRLISVRSVLRTESGYIKKEKAHNERAKNMLQNKKALEQRLVVQRIQQRKNSLSIIHCHLAYL